MVKVNWQTKELAQVCEHISRGVSPRYVNREGIFVLNQKCVRDHLVNYSEARLHDPRKTFSNEKMIQIGDVLVNSTGTGTLGRVAQVKKLDMPTIVDSHVTIVRPTRSVFDVGFFGWVMVVVEELIQQMGEGASGQTELSRIALRSMSVSFPESIVEQHRIAALLDEAFLAISKAKENAEKNLKNSRELFESYLQSVFAKPGKGWIKKTLDEIAVNLDSKRVPITKRLRSVGDFPYYGASGVVDHVSRFIFEGDFLLVSEDGANLLARTYPIAFSVSGKTWVNNHAHVLRFEEKTSQVFVEFYLNSIRLDKYVSGMAQPKLNQKMLNSIVIPFPPLPEQKFIVAKLDALSEQTKKLEKIYHQKLDLLEELKKSILKKAFAGEL